MFMDDYIFEIYDIPLLLLSKDGQNNYNITFAPDN